MIAELTHPRNTHERWMLEAIQLAEQGRGHVEPNPMVGCIVVKDGIKIAEGFHERFGQAHAEVNALSKLAPSQIADSTIYVTLEPCAHVGKTPPCVDLLIRSKPKLVVIGTEDPFHEVAGRGINRLHEAGIDVIRDIQREACERLIAPYLKRLRTGLPWIIAKWAMTLDGRLATHTQNSKWVTSELAREHAHRVRSAVDGIMIGVGTLLADDPTLTARPTRSDSSVANKYSEACNRKPIRIVLDRMARTPIDTNLIRTSRENRTIVGCGPNADKRRISTLEANGCEVVVSSGDDTPTMIRDVSTKLVQDGMTNLLVDGGPKLIGSLVDHHLVDEVHVYIAPKIVGGPPSVVPNYGQGVLRMELANRITHSSWRALGEDLFFTGLCNYSPTKSNVSARD